MSNLQSRQLSTHTVRSSATLTASYVAGTVFTMDQDNYLTLIVDYTKGDETSMQLKIEASFDNSTYAQQVAESTSGGTITVSLAERSFSATGKYAIEVQPTRAKFIKVSVKATGGTPTGTAAITAGHSWS